MRIKTRTAGELRTGMVVRGRGIDTYGLPMTVFRQVVTVKPVPGWRHDRYITFTDGSGARVGATTEFQVARGKTIRRTVAAHATRPAAAGIEGALTLIGSYSLTTTWTENHRG